jgi:hypothetical protein
METQSPNPEGNTQAEDSTAVRQSAAELVEKHKKQRSDKGKPRGPRNKANTESAVATPVPDAVVQLNIELVKRSVTALVKTTDSIITRRIYNKTIALGADKNVATEYAQAAGLSIDESQIIAECTAVIVGRSDFLIQHAPEAMLACVVIMYGVRVVGTFKRLDELEAALKAKDRKAKPLEPSAQ